MAWLNPFRAEWNTWAARSITRGWPNVNEERRNDNYWFVNQGPGVAPMMSRYVTQFFYKAFSTDALYVEFLTSGSGDGVYVAASGLNILGQQLDLTVTDHATPHPVHGDRGVSMEFLYTRVGFTVPVTSELFWPVPQPGDEPVPYFFDHQNNSPEPTPPPFWTTTYRVGQDTDWTNEQLQGSLQFVSISSGRTIPRN